LWVTFLPCFAWIFLGAPYVERLHDAARLKGALAGVTAAVVGVIANLALWFALRVVFAEIVPGPLGFDVPVLASIQPLALALVLLAGGCIFLWRLGVLASLGIAAAAGIFTTML
ncbi:MAG: chromate transporter, partial [Rhodospirillales bacterium]|nr:chromate transporter [Rhodospirillales bacterium]